MNYPPKKTEFRGTTQTVQDLYGVITNRNSLMWEKRFLKETPAIIQAVIVKRRHNNLIGPQHKDSLDKELNRKTWNNQSTGNLSGQDRSYSYDPYKQPTNSITMTQGSGMNKNIPSNSNTAYNTNKVPSNPKKNKEEIGLLDIQ